MIEAIYMAHEVNQKIITFIDTIVAEVGKQKHEYTSCAVPEELFAAIKEIVPPEEMEKAVFTDDKQTREENIRVLTERMDVRSPRSVRWQQKLILSREYMVLQCSLVDRLRSVTCVHWLRCLSSRRSMDWMRMK